MKDELRPCDHYLNTDPHTLSLNEYQGHVSRLLSPITEQVLERFTRPEITTAFSLMLIDMMHLSKLADNIKKAAFYGKPESFENLKYSFNFTEVNEPYTLSDKSKDPGFYEALHGLLGITSELFEVWAELAGYFDDPSEERKTALIKELGDLAFYPSAIAKGINTTMGEVALVNIDKLWTRFKNGFSEKAALERADMQKDSSAE